MRNRVKFLFCPKFTEVFPFPPIPDEAVPVFTIGTSFFGHSHAIALQL